ncbi:MAG: hypothetical protein AB1482_06815, partial [Pseudomonadota bacterium]
TGRVSVLAVVAAPGCALRDNDSANRINQLPDYEFAQLDAHNSAMAVWLTSAKPAKASLHTSSFIIATLLSLETVGLSHLEERDRRTTYPYRSARCLAL